MNNGGILLCGGAGTRLFPTTSYINKHLIPIYDKPMSYYSLSILFLSGIKNITIVCNGKDLSTFKSLLGDGEQFGVQFNYSVQKVLMVFHMQLIMLYWKKPMKNLLLF